MLLISGYLSGTGRLSGIVGYFTFETAHYHPAAGRDLFSVCQKWSDGSFADLVGIPITEVIACLVGYVFLKRIRKNKVDTLS